MELWRDFQTVPSPKPAAYHRPGTRLHPKRQHSPRWNRRLQLLCKLLVGFSQTSRASTIPHISWDLKILLGEAQELVKER